jgi:hypothetical protein
MVQLLSVAKAVGSAVLAKGAPIGNLGALFLARASQSAYSAGLLAQNGLNADAMSVGRTVTEMLIDFRYIVLDPDKRIKQFEDYGDVAKFKLMKAVDALHGGTLDQNAMKILEKRHDDARINHPDSKRNWAGADIFQRAEEIDKRTTAKGINYVEEVYRISYVDACNASHSGYGTLEYAMARDDDGDIASVCFGRMPPQPKPVETAFGMLLVLIGVVFDANKLDEKSEVADQIRAVHAAWNAYVEKKAAQAGVELAKMAPLDRA